MNLDTEEQAARLERLLVRVEVVPEASADARLPEGVSLAEKDRPILLAAIYSGATHLLTGDVSHFGPLFGQKAGGVLVLRPGTYLRPAEADPP